MTIITSFLLPVVSLYGGAGNLACSRLSAGSSTDMQARPAGRKAGCRQDCLPHKVALQCP